MLLQVLLDGKMSYWAVAVFGVVVGPSSACCSNRGASTLPC